MLKFLYLIRHAQAEEQASSGKDFDRELNSTGKADAKLIGKKLHEMDIHPQCWITSPAARTLQTAELVGESYHLKKTELVKEQRIYDASTKALLEVINDIDEKYKSAVLFGHNPGFYDVANLLLDSEIHSFPKAGVVAIAFSLPWEKITAGTGMLQFFISPKQYT